MEYGIAPLLDVYIYLVDCVGRMRFLIYGEAEGIPHIDC